MTRIPSSRATIAAGTRPPRVMHTIAANGPAPLSRQASARESRWNWSHDTGNALDGAAASFMATSCRCRHRRLPARAANAGATGRRFVARPDADGEPVKNRDIGFGQERLGGSRPTWRANARFWQVFAETAFHFR